MFIFNYALQPFKAYCTIWVRGFNFRHQASPRESTQRRKVELCARNIREFCLNFDFHVTFRNLLHAVKVRNESDGFTSPPKEDVLRIFFAPKNPGANPGTWVPKASTVPLTEAAYSRCVGDKPISRPFVPFCYHDNETAYRNTIALSNEPTACDILATSTLTLHYSLPRLFPHFAKFYFLPHYCTKHIRQSPKQQIFFQNSRPTKLV
jgi:hypothetical protein